MVNLIEYLNEACGKGKREVSKSNPYRMIGFDGEKPRLGWVKIPAWEDIEGALKECMSVIGDKKQFVFIGMGGSINGVKTLASLAARKSIFCLDSLDPQALQDVLGGLRDLSETAVIAISKSGGTLETQTLAATMRDVMTYSLGRSKVKEHFLWLIDMDSSSKLDSFGWRGIRRLPIQVDGGNDIGGRFSSPHTLVFLLPLFIILGKDFGRLRRIYDIYAGMKRKIVRRAFGDAYRCRNRRRAYFYIRVPAKVEGSFRTWITQLFQESVGSKKKGVCVKTLVSSKARPPVKGFFPILFDVEAADAFIKIMAKMHYLQHFVAFYSAFQKINFVNQPCVETYKKKMKVLTVKDIKPEMVVSIAALCREIEAKLKKTPARFIEIVLYFHPERKITAGIRRGLSDRLPSKPVFMFVGSDWNHHSYQAAYRDKDTLFVLLTRRNYLEVIRGWELGRGRLQENAALLRLIAYATHLTLKRTSVLYAID